jgi:FixJ family two-component response regulator
MTEISPIVFVIDDEPSVRASLKRLIGSVGLQVQTFSSAKEFLKITRPDGPACLVLDVRLPDLSGLELQQELTTAKESLPIVFITGHGDIPMSVRAMKAGAIEFLTKPFREQDLLEAIHQGIDRNRAAQLLFAEVAYLRQHYSSLTPREREVFRLVASGLLNKQIAGRLGTSEKTVKVHRGQVMHKMKATSLVQLIHMAERLGVGSPQY